MILTIGNVKGGVGKTTLAVNLTIIRASEGKDVLLVDGDEQGTALTFTQLRSEKLGTPGYTAVRLHGAALRTQVRELAAKFAEIVIDVGGRDTASLRAALTVSDTLVIPLQPRSFDVWAIDQMAMLVKDAREINPHLLACALLNAADAIGRDNQDALDALKDISGIEVLPLTIGRRKAFPNAASEGLSVSEHRPTNPKALAELRQLFALLYT